MNNFFLFLKKELKDLLTLQSILPLIIMLVVFSIIGGLIGDIEEDISKNFETVVLMDQDDSEYSKAVIEKIEADYRVVTLQKDLGETEALERLDQENLNCYVRIPKGFGKTVFEDHEVASVQTVCRITSLSVTGRAGMEAESIASNAVNEAVSSILIETDGADDAAFVKYPVTADRKSYLNEKSADVSAQAVAGAVMSQSMFLPIALFVVIVFAAQMTAASMATEKSDKTFETLLSMPVSRTTILMAKMISVGIMGIIYAAVYLLGFSFIMGGGGGFFGAGGAVPAETLSALGLTLGAGQYLIIGINVLLSIMVALALSIIVGVASKDVKAAQGAIAPLMFVIMIPYIISLVADINALPVVLKVIVYLIPFSHTFSAISNIYMGDYLMIIIGVVYQAIALTITIILALKIFHSDKALTMNLDFRRRRTLTRKTKSRRELY